MIMKRMVIKAFVFGVFSLFMGLSTSPAMALPIVFHLGQGGDVSYAGGNSPLITTNGVVSSVENWDGSVSVGISGGEMDFSTGDLISSSGSGSSFSYGFDAGGSFTINGDVGSGSVLLMSGDFSGFSTFDCCSSSLSSFSGLLNVSYVDPGLASQLGFALPPIGGSVAQVEFFFPTVPTMGGSFTGIQGGGAVLVDSTASVPEPSSLILLGIGLIGFAIIHRKLHSTKRIRETN